jgi:hypothetical protein
MFAATVNNMPRKAIGHVRLMDADEIQPSDPSNKFVHLPPSDNRTALYTGTFATEIEARKATHEWFGKAIIE